MYQVKHGPGEIQINYDVLWGMIKPAMKHDPANNVAHRVAFMVRSLKIAFRSPLKSYQLERFGREREVRCLSTNLHVALLHYNLQ